MGIFDFFSKKENTQGTTASQTQGGQQGTGFSQSNVWPQISGYLGNFGNVFSPQGPNQYQTGAANAQAGLGAALAPAFQSAWNVAGQGIQDADINRFSNQYDTSVINNMIADYAKQNQQTLDAGRGRQAAQSALGNRTGADALILEGQQGAQADAIMKARQGGFNTATGLARDNAALQLQGAGQLGQLGSVASGINQAGFGMGQQLWQNPFAQFGQVSSAISPWAQASGQSTNYGGTSWGNTTGQTNQTTTKQPSPWEILTGVAGTAMAMFSDERVKDDIETIGETFDGQPIYRYTKFGVPEIGLMAQDVEKRDPDAVGSLGGIKTLDKFRATEGAARKGRFALGGGVGGLMSLPGMGGALDLMKEKGLPSGGLMESAGVDLGSLGHMAGFGMPMGFNAGGAVSNSSFADKVKAAHAAVKEMSEGGKVERPGAAFGGWEPTLTMGSMSPGDADAMVDTANSNQWGQDFKKWGDALKGSKIGGGDDDRGGGGGSSAMDALARSQAGLGQFVAQSDPRHYLPKMALGGVPGMYAGGDPDIYEAEPVAPPSLGEINPDLSQYFDRRALDVAPSAPPPPAEVAGARYDAPLPPPRYEPAPPRERGFVQGVKDLFSGNFREGLAGLTANDAHSATPNWGGKWGPTFMSMSSLTGDAARNILAQQKERNDKLNAERAAEMRLAELRGQLPATMGGGETLAARQLARQLEADKAAEAHRTRVWEETMRHNREQEIPAVVKQVEAMGYPKGTPEHNAMVRKIIEKADRGETEFDKGIGKASAGDLEKRAEAIRASQGKIQSLNQMETLVNDPRLQNAQGKYAGWWLEGKKIAQALGFPMEGVKEAEALRALGNQFALQLRSTAGGEGMPGALSDQDRNFLLASVPGLENTPGGNRVMIKMMREVENYKVRANTEAQKYIAERKSNVGLGDYMSRWMQENPMLSEETRKEAQKVLDAGPQQQPNTAVTGPDTETAPTSAAAQPVGSRRMVNGTEYEKTANGWVRVSPTIGEVVSP